MTESGPAAEHLEKRADWLSVVWVVSHAVLVLGPLFLAVSMPPGGWWLACYLWFGVTVHGLLNLLHECAHYHVFSARAGSDVIGRWLLGPLVFTDFDAFRRRHWDHHRYLGEPGDTKEGYHTTISGWGAPALLYRCLSLTVAIRKWRLQTRGDAERLSRPAIVRTAIVQVVFLSLLLVSAKSAAGASWGIALQRTAIFYVGVFVYGLASVAPFVATLRAIAEHQPGADGAPAQGWAVLRNFRCGPLERFVFGAYGFADHATHHFHPAVPAYRLPELTRRGDAEMLGHRGSFVKTLIMLSRSPADAAGTARSA